MVGGVVQAVVDDVVELSAPTATLPKASWFDAQALDDFLQDVPEHVLVVLDEAYIEYAEGS
ncbi:hypothetical protein, partial [Klebsiella variicola]|uniref:hypothetical protein n=1 Tax=Klebsiella variicola TaxID=244366 RepID=UPI002730EDC2